MEKCQAELGIGNTTQYCQLEAGHEGQHYSKWHHYGYPVEIKWEQDERDLDDDYEP